MLKEFMGICMTMEEEGSLTKKKRVAPSITCSGVHQAMAKQETNISGTSSTGRDEDNTQKSQIVRASQQLLKRGRASPFGRRGFHLARLFEWLRW